MTAANLDAVILQVPLLAAALPWVGHAATRNRGTVGGSVANADPAAEIPLVLVTLKGSVVLRCSAGAKTIMADDFFIGPMMTAITPGCCLTEVHFPVWQGQRVGVGFQEISARRSDFALAAAAAQVALDGDGRCVACALGVGGATAVPQRLDGAAEALVGSRLSDDAIGEAVRAAVETIAIMSSPARERRLPSPRGFDARHPRARAGARPCAGARGCMKVELLVNGKARQVDVEPRTTLVDCLRDHLDLMGVHTGCEHGICGACTVLVDGEPSRSCLMFAVQADGYAITTVEALAPAPGELSVIQDAFCETHGLQCGFCTSGHDPGGARAAPAQSRALARRYRRGDLRQHLPLHRLRADRGGDRAGGATACRIECRAGARPVSDAAFKFVSTNRRVREDRRFVVGRGSYVADIKRDGMLHVAIVASSYPAARIRAIDAAEALAMPGVHHVVTGAELAAAVDPMMNGLDTPKVRRYSLAVGQARYSGEWIAAVVADSRALAEDAAERVVVEYDPLPHVIDVEQALDPASPQVHPEHGSNVLLDKTFVWGEVDRHFAESPRSLSFRVTWGRNSTVPIETFGVLASWDPWREMLDVWASIQMPKYSEQIARALRLPANAVRVHYDVDVGGSYGVKRGIKHTVLVCHLARLLGRPVRLIEDRLDNMRSGDAHGPERIFDVAVAFDDAGIVRSMKMRAHRQCRCLCGPRAVPARQADRRDRRSVQDREREIPRALGDDQQGRAGGGARLRPVADELRDRDRDRQGRGRHGHRPHRGAAAQFHPQGRIPVPHPERHALRQRRPTTPWSTRCWRMSTGSPCRASATACARAACSPASASRRASSRAAAIRRSSRCSTRRTPPRRGWTPAASWSTGSAT